LDKLSGIFSVIAITNFHAVLKDTPATFDVVEFFANWLVFIHFD